MRLFDISVTTDKRHKMGSRGEHGMGLSTSMGACVAKVPVEGIDRRTEAARLGCAVLWEKRDMWKR